MKPPKSAGDQLQNELEALDMIQHGPPAWLDLYRQVREYLVLEARAKAGNLPADNKAAAIARRHLRYVLDTLDGAERDLKAPPVVFDFTRQGGDA